MKLNRHNYEEYFILYMDNELTPEDRREVEAFAVANPDLKEELDMLLQTKFTPDTSITFDLKDSLLVRNSSAIDMNNYEEWLLCYIDNELTAEEIKDVEKFVAAHPEAKKELELLQRAKLQPESISFPNKESLYRKEEQAKVLPVRWWRAAAAVLLIAASAVSVYILNDKPAKQNGSVAGTNNSATKQTPSVEAKTVNDAMQPVTILPAVKEDIAVTNANEVKEDNRPAVKKTDNYTTEDNNAVAIAKEQKAAPQRIVKDLVNDQDNKALASNDGQKPKTNDLPTPTKDNPYVASQANNERENHAFANTNVPDKDVLTNVKDIPVDKNVTPQSAYAYNKKEAGSEGVTSKEDNADFTFASNDEKKNKNRGFFRKIARTIEKRTNIKATDEDDRLLIAGLAIKLK